MSITTLDKLEIFRTHWKQIDTYFSLLNYSVNQEIASIENTFFLKTNYTSRNGKITASFGYFPLDAWNNLQEIVYGNLYSQNQLSISILKFGEIELNCGKDDFSLLKYAGSFEEKASSLCTFFLSILSSQKLRLILDQTQWSNIYHVPWYDGIDG